MLSGLEILGESYPHLCDMRNNGARHLIMSVIPLTAEVENFDPVCLAIPITWLVPITIKYILGPRQRKLSCHIVSAQPLLLSSDQDVLTESSQFLISQGKFVFL